jgi:hypothetical protein
LRVERQSFLKDFLPRRLFLFTAPYSVSIFDLESDRLTDAYLPSERWEGIWDDAFPDLLHALKRVTAKLAAKAKAEELAARP